MTLRKAIDTLNENADDCLTPGRNSAWNTNAALISLVKGLAEEFAQMNEKLDRLRGQIDRLEQRLGQDRSG